jgi:hypothetical protein
VFVAVLFTFVWLVPRRRRSAVRSQLEGERDLVAVAG